MRVVRWMVVSALLTSAGCYRHHERVDGFVSDAAVDGASSGSARRRIPGLVFAPRTPTARGHASGAYATTPWRSRQAPPVPARVAPRARSCAGEPIAWVSWGMGRRTIALRPSEFLAWTMPSSLRPADTTPAYAAPRGRSSARASASMGSSATGRAWIATPWRRSWGWWMRWRSRAVGIKAVPPTTPARVEPRGRSSVGVGTSRAKSATERESSGMRLSRCLGSGRSCRSPATWTPPARVARLAPSRVGGPTCTAFWETTRILPVIYRGR